MINKRVKSLKGVTLIELMVSILILTVVLMAFAMVFPSGYRLSQKSRNENRAAQLAYGVVNKLQNMEFSRTDVFGGYSNVPTLENMVTYDPSSSRSFDQYFGIDSTRHFLDSNGKATIYFLPITGEIPEGKGIMINYNPSDTSSTTVALDPTWATFTVNVAWVEYDKGGKRRVKSVAITGTRSNNH